MVVTLKNTNKERPNTKYKNIETDMMACILQNRFKSVTL